MISALHLIWIIPSCLGIGVMVMGFIAGATLPTAEYDAYVTGIQDGYNQAKKEFEQNDIERTV